MRSDTHCDTSFQYAFRGAEILVSAAPDGAPDFDPGPAPWPGAAPESALDRFALRPDSRESALVLPDGQAAPPGYAWAPLRGFIGAAQDERAWFPAARALSLAAWRASSRFCGRCGEPNGDKGDETARLCPACGAIVYPRLSPAVLALVRKGDRILLARNARFVSGVQSILAGFVEPGETLEQCVIREVREEVGIEVANPRYRGSQPWPFPDSLMLGFVCDWVSGELAPDGAEIAEAGWYGPDEHPGLPMRGSLSRRLIDAAFAEISGARPS